MSTTKKQTVSLCGAEVLLAEDPGDGLPAVGMLTRLLARAAPDPQGQRVVELGCGAGSLGISMLLRGARHVTFNDVQSAAIRWTRENLVLNGIDPTCYSLAEGSLDTLDLAILCSNTTVLFNPPQFPLSWSELDYPPTERIFRAGGSDGLDVVRRFAGWFSSGSHKAVAYLSISSALSPSVTHNLFSANGLVSEVVEAQPHALRRILWAGAERLSQAERTERRLSRQDEGWQKDVLIYRVHH